MQRKNRSRVTLLAAATLLLSACAQLPATTPKAEPFKLEKLEGTDLNRLVVAAKAVEHIGITTAQIRELVPAGGAVRRKAVEYAALIYDPQGKTFVYTNPEPLVFVRSVVVVDRIDGDVAVLSDGPPVGTAVVTVGAAELFGMEFGVGK